MLPRDRLLRAGATVAEVDHMEARSQGEVQSMELQLAGMAESGVHDFVVNYRSMVQNLGERIDEEVDGVNVPVDKPAVDELPPPDEGTLQTDVHPNGPDH